MTGWGGYLKVFKFYVLIMTIFWEKRGIIFKGGHYIRENIIQGNTVVRLQARYELKWMDGCFINAIHSSYSLQIKVGYRLGYYKLHKMLF